MKLIVTALGAAAGVVTASAAQAAAIDVSPIVNEAIADILVPVLVATVPAVAAVVTLPIKRYLDQRAGDLLASRVSDVLDKGIAYGAQRAEQWVTDENFHANVNGWVANVAADYAVGHAPALMRQAGALAAAKAGDVAREQASKLLTEKIAARIVDHPAVAAVKALAPAAAPIAKAA